MIDAAACLISVPGRLLRSFATFSLIVWILASASRAQPGPQLSGPDPNQASAPRQSTPSDLVLHDRPLRIDVDLVLVPVSVTDSFSRPVLGLTRENFAIFEGGQQQQIRLFSCEDTPLSIGLVLDISKSMSDKIDAERAALAEFAKHANPLDDYFAIGVTTRPILLTGSTRDITDVESKLAVAEPDGATALMDAIYLALNKLRSARYERRALLLISDGGDNESRYKSKEIRSLAEESGVLIYAIRPNDALPVFRSIEEKMGNRGLSTVTDATGGHTVAINSAEEIAEAAAAISLELRNQYVLGYKAPESDHSGKLRRIKVQIMKSGRKLPVQARYKNSYLPTR